MTVDLKQRIIGTALKYLYDFGVEKFDLDRLTKDLDIESKVLYELYPTKRDLVYAVISSTLDNIQQLFRAVNNKAGNPISTLYEYNLIMTITFYNRTQFTLSHELKETYTDIFDEVMERTQELMRSSYATNYLRGFQLGFYKQFSKIEDMIEEHISSNGMLHKWDANLSNTELKTANKQLIDLWLTQITTDLGKQEMKRIADEITSNI